NVYDYLEDLAAKNELPDLETILANAKTLSERYTSQAAILRSLSAATSTNPAQPNKIPVGSAWLVEITEGASTAKPADAPKIHEEHPGFDGDRVLRNHCIFLTDFSWWIEFAQAVPEGEIDRVWAIMKLWIFKFAGSSHQNYMAYLLEVYCLLRYEASKDLKNAILNNWLVCISGELGIWLPGDLHQKHYNRWLEDMEEVHLFRSGRRMGHAAVNQFARGCRRLDEGKLADFLMKSTCFGDVFDEIKRKSDVTTGDTTTTDTTDADMRSDSPALSIPESSSESESGSSHSTSSTSS
ncbi:hypothetical protein B0H13DRAFT_1537749, partial [Mycena leptocephala]